MSTMEKSYFDKLPIEILHKIYDELDTETILFSVRGLSKRLYEVTNNYNRHRLNFRYVSRSNLRVMARLIDPNNVISLTLSDSLETDGQIRLFLSYFDLNRFIRLRSLTLMSINYEDLCVFHGYIKKCYCLTTISISYGDKNWENLNDFLLSALSIDSLYKLETQMIYNMDGNLRWPIQCRLEYLTLIGERSWNNVYFILSHSPYLQRLVLKTSYMPNFDKNIVTQSDMKQFGNLRSLSLNISGDLTMNDFQLIFTMFPNLTHLRLFATTFKNDNSLFNGYQWENLIETKLPLLDQFEFCFKSRTAANQDFTVMDSLIASFRTPFWLENKQWIIKYDYECDKKHIEYLISTQSTDKDNSDYHHRSYLYTVPIIRDQFGYANQQTRIFLEDESISTEDQEAVILNSVMNILDNNQPLIVDSNELILNMDQIIKEIKTGSTIKYKFINVTQLKLSICREWSTDLIEHLSTIVNLSNIEKLYLDFQCVCLFDRTLKIEINDLFKRTSSLRSIRIRCDIGDEFMVKTTRNRIALELPHYIRKFDVQIRYLGDAKLLLKQCKHLSNILFRPYYQPYPKKYIRGVVLANDIKHWLTKIKRDFRSKLDMGMFVGCDCCDSLKTMCIWLDKVYQ